MKNSPKFLGHIIFFLIPAGYLGLVLYFDRLESFQTISPPLLSIGLLLFSLFISPYWMVFWAVVYSSVVTEIMLNPKLYSFFSGGMYPPEITSHKFRVIGFISTAIFSCVFSFVLSRIKKKKAIVDNLIMQMPIPVIISDISGNICLGNERAKDFFSKDIATLKYFDLLAPKLHQGKCIAKYLGFFQEGTSTGSTIELEFKGRPLSAAVELLKTTPLQLVTMFTSHPSTEEAL